MRILYISAPSKTPSLPTMSTAPAQESDLLAARDLGVRKVVFASSSSVYGDTPVLPKEESMVPAPLSPYGVSKLTGEHYCKVFSELYGLQTVTMRYFYVFDPRQDPASEYAAVIPKFITCTLKKESPVIYGDGSQTRDFTFVKDVVLANIGAMESSAQGIFNVAYQEQIDLKAHSSISRMGLDTAAVPEGAARTKWNVSSLPPRSCRWPLYPG